jgi:hypothetical protein
MATVDAMKAGKSISLVIAIFVLLAAIFIFNKWQNYKDPQGEASDNCIKVDLPTVSNRSGLVVTAHNTACDALGGTSAVYVYVHRSGAPDSRENLVFRFADRYDARPPTIAWTNESSLLISVSHVSEVTKQLNTMQGINISYVIGKEDYPQENARR